MKPSFKLILGSIIALTLGLAAASPILVPNLALTEKVQIEVDVVYAYIGVQNFTQDMTGLWRNSSSIYEYDLHMVSYFIVLNITNLSNKIALIREFEASAAQETTVEQLPNEGTRVSQTNPIVGNYRDVSGYYPGWSQYWSPNSSRLVAFSGIVELSNAGAYNALRTGAIFLFGKAEAKPLGGGQQSSAYSLKHVQLQTIGKEYLYNAVLSENQMWRMDTNGIDVFIETRH
jgi:hypothetical protein